jgi:hypothetical protein
MSPSGAAVMFVATLARVSFHNRDLDYHLTLSRVPAPRRNPNLRRGVLTLPTTKMLRATRSPVLARSQYRVGNQRRTESGLTAVRCAQGLAVGRDVA